MKAYPNYKDSGVPWLGEVPENWVFKRSKSVFRALDIRSAEGKEELLSVSEKNGVALRKNTNVTMFQAASYAGYKLCWPNDLVINSLWAWMTGLGFSKYHGIISTAYSVFRIWNQGKFDSHYGNYLLRSKAYNWEFRVRSKGIWRSRYQLSDDSFLSMPLLLPPLNEQQQIARYLDWQTAQINKFINAKKKLIALLKEQKQNIINEAVTKGLNPNVLMKDSGVEWLGDIPAHWEVRKLKSVARIKNGKDYKEVEADTGYPVIGSGGQFAYSSQFMYEGESVLFGRKGTIDKPLYINSRFWTVDTMFYTEVSTKVIVKFLYYNALLFPFSYYSTKTALPSMTQKDLGNHPLAIPPIDEQQQIIAHIEKETTLIDKTITRAEREIELIQEYRTRLVSDVVTGKVDVRSVAVPDFEAVEEEIDTQDDAVSEDELIMEDSEE